MKKVKEFIKRKWRTILGVAISLALIVIGSYLKYHSPALLGDILTLIGVIIGLYMLLSDHQGDILKNQAKMISNQEKMVTNQDKMVNNQDRMINILEEIRDTLRKG